MGLRVAVQQQERWPTTANHQVNFGTGCRDLPAVEFRKELGHCGTPRFLRAARIVPRCVLRRAACRGWSSENTSSHADQCNAENTSPREGGPNRQATALRKSRPARHKYRTQSWSRRTRTEAPMLVLSSFGRTRLQLNINVNFLPSDQERP